MCKLLQSLAHSLVAHPMSRAPSGHEWALQLGTLLSDWAAAGRSGKPRPDCAPLSGAARPPCRDAPCGPLPSVGSVGVLRKHRGWPVGMGLMRGNRSLSVLIDKVSLSGRLMRGGLGRVLTPGGGLGWAFAVKDTCPLPLTPTPCSCSLSEPGFPPWAELLLWVWVAGVR